MGDRKRFAPTSLSVYIAREAKQRRKKDELGNVLRRGSLHSRITRGPPEQRGGGRSSRPRVWEQFRSTFIVSFFRTHEEKKCHAFSPRHISSATPTRETHPYSILKHLPLHHHPYSIGPGRTLGHLIRSSAYTSYLSCQHGRSIPRSIQHRLGHRA
jgi:hypothetical protein